MNLTNKMDRALAMAVWNGAVFAGGGNKFRPGRLVSVSPITIKALAARGLVKIQTSPDGGIMGRITIEGTREVESAIGRLSALDRK